MEIGAMNHPGHKVEEEIRWMAGMGLDFIDLTLEPPAAGAWQIDLPVVRQALREHGLRVVGHTAYYLPLGHPFERVRRGALDEFARCAEIFAGLGAAWMNVHPDRKAPMHDRNYVVERNLQSLRELLEIGRTAGIGMMVENLPDDFNTAATLAALLQPLPGLGLHLDLGHTNLNPYDTAEEILAAWGSRVKHVHLHDNLGGTVDLHLPLGAGTVDLGRSVRALRRAGYDGTITLEVFAPDREFLRYSVRKLRQVWEEA
jgi:sugar phosphate isomerase/epimerase